MSRRRRSHAKSQRVWVEVNKGQYGIVKVRVSPTLPYEGPRVRAEGAIMKRDTREVVRKLSVRPSRIERALKQMNRSTCMMEAKRW